jgi:hypothetical protein
MLRSQHLANSHKQALAGVVMAYLMCAIVGCLVVTSRGEKLVGRQLFLSAQSSEVRFRDEAVHHAAGIRVHAGDPARIIQSHGVGGFGIWVCN